MKFAPGCDEKIGRSETRSAIFLSFLIFPFSLIGRKKKKMKKKKGEKKNQQKNKNKETIYTSFSSSMHAGRGLHKVNEFAMSLDIKREETALFLCM